MASSRLVLPWPFPPRIQLAPDENPSWHSEKFRKNLTDNRERIMPTRRTIHPNLFSSYTLIGMTTYR